MERDGKPSLIIGHHLSSFIFGVWMVSLSLVLVVNAKKERANILGLEGKV
jgi:hypothetical protein